MQFSTKSINVTHCGYLVAEMEENAPYRCTADNGQIIRIDIYQGAWGPSGEIGLWVPPSENADDDAETWSGGYGWWRYLAFSCMPGPGEYETTLAVYEPAGTEFGQPGRLLKSFTVHNSLLPDALEDGEDAPEAVDTAWRLLLEVFSQPFRFRPFQEVDRAKLAIGRGAIQGHPASLDETGA